MEMKDDLRILRARVEDMERRISTISRQAGSSAAHMIGEVVDKGDMPTSLPAVFAVHPTSISADAVENSEPTLTSEDVDGIAFVVLGTRAPQAGYHLVASLVDGRWVAEVSSNRCNLADDAKIGVLVHRCISLSSRVVGAHILIQLWVPDEEPEVVDPPPDPPLPEEQNPEIEENGYWKFVGSGETDATGQFELPIEEQGKYRIAVTFASNAAYEQEFDIICGSNNIITAFEDNFSIIIKGCTIFARPVVGATLTATFTNTGHVYVGRVRTPPSDYWTNIGSNQYLRHCIVHAEEDGPFHAKIEAERFQTQEYWMIKFPGCGASIGLDVSKYAPNTAVPLPDSGLIGTLIPTDSYVCPYWVNTYATGFNANGVYSHAYPVGKTLLWDDKLLGEVILTYNDDINPLARAWVGTGSYSGSNCGNVGNRDYTVSLSNTNTSLGVPLRVLSTDGPPYSGATYFLNPMDTPLGFPGVTFPPPGMVTIGQAEFSSGQLGGAYACIPLELRDPMFPNTAAWIGWLSEL